MKQLRKVQIMIVVAIAFIMLASCTLPEDAVIPISTQTFIANATIAEQVAETGTALHETTVYELTQGVITATNTPVPTDSATPSPTITPTRTPRPTNTPQPTATPIPCNWGSFIMDVTVPDNSVFVPNTVFTKVWRLQNVGTCSWTPDYEVVFFDGDDMDANAVTDLNEVVEPGEYIDIALEMRAPANPGNYQGYWILQADDGEIFGVGLDAEHSFWAEIDVVTPVTDYKYDFSHRFCEANWQDDQETLYCYGSVFAEDNYVQITNNPSLEDGRTENEFAIWMNVNRGDSITGTYPPISIESGDRFISGIGCLEESRECRVEFSVSYRIEGTNSVVELGSWVEEHDGNVQVIDLDLSSLAGEDVVFILRVESLTNVVTNRPVWFVPSIRNP